MFKIVKVVEDSMSPDLIQGDYLLLLKKGWLGNIRPGDVVAFRLEPYGLMVKRVDHLLDHGRQLFVVGKHPHSVDSRAFGPIDETTVIGKMLWHFRAPRKDKHAE
jgi:signal peptidase I